LDGFNSCFASSIGSGPWHSPCPAVAVFRRLLALS
jgi:hypothetical protein